MQDLRITRVQANQVWEDKAANFSNYTRLLQEVDTDLIVLPEMFQTGFSMNTEALGESMENSESIDWLKELAREKNAAVYTSLIIVENGQAYNRGVFVKPDLSIQYYDKRKTFGLAGEDKHFASGTNEVIVEYQGWKLQLQICYDLRFPEIVRNRTTSNQSFAYDVILYVANWPAKRNLHWKTLLRARAIENQCFVIGVNRVGEDKLGLSYTGDSLLIDALGNEQQMNANQEAIVTNTINMDELLKIREALPFLRDR